MSKRPTLIIVICVVILAGFLSTRSIAYDWFTVPSISMQPTINPGATVFVDKAAYGIRYPFSNSWVSGPRMPQRGDLVTFRYPRDPKKIYIKRVLAVGGDQLEISPSGDIYINGEKLEKRTLPPEESPDQNSTYFLESNGQVSYLIASQDRQTTPMSATTIAPGKFFVIGDNRDRSSDSRLWGSVPLDHILGQVQFTDNRISPILNKFE